METATRLSQTARPTDRLLEALATVAALLDRTINEVKSVDKEFQSRLLQAVHDTEASLQSQAAQHVDQVIVETGDKIRRELTDKFTVEVKRLQAEFEAERDHLSRELGRSAEAATVLEEERARLRAELDRMRHDAQTEIQKAHATAQHLEQSLSEAAEKVRRELTDKFTAEIKKLQTEFDDERERLSRELARSVEAVALGDAEQSRLKSELDRVRQEADAELHKAREAAAAAAAASAASNGSHNSAVNDEIARAENRLREIVAIIDDPATELSTVIRKNVERSEVESYLKGIRFVARNGK